jgi:hypothetical protein
MRYLMLVCVDKTVELTAEEKATIGPDVEAWIKEMDGHLTLSGAQSVGALVR